ncbi:hypothetical protein GCM10025734_14410 [Kitasatospora paranensis]
MSARVVAGVRFPGSGFLSRSSDAYQRREANAPRTMVTWRDLAIRALLARGLSFGCGALAGPTSIPEEVGVSGYGMT